MKKLNKEIVTYIYTLSNPINNEVRYVGKTINLNKRHQQHINRNTNTKTTKWIRSLLEKGITPTIDCIDVVSNDDYCFWESHYISLYRSWGFRLTNLTDGGEGSIGYKHTKESRLKISAIDRSGVHNSMYGKKHKNTAKNIMSIKKIGLYDGINNPRAKKLYQYDISDNLIKVWNFAKECADEIHASRGNISSAAKFNSHLDVSKYKIVSGFIFKFK